MRKYRPFVFHLWRDWYRTNGRQGVLFIAFGFHGELVEDGFLAPCRFAIELRISNPFNLWVRRDGPSIRRLQQERDAA